MSALLQIAPVELSRELEGETFVYDGSPAHALVAWDLPLLVHCGTVRDLDGEPVAAVLMQNMGFVITRTTAEGAPEEVYDTDAGWVTLDVSVAPAESSLRSAVS